MTNTRHRNADVIIAFAEGRQIQSRGIGDEYWVDRSDLDAIGFTSIEWRIKPEKRRIWIATDGVRIIPGIGRLEALESFAKAHPAAKHLIQACIEIEYEPGEGL